MQCHLPPLNIGNQRCHHQPAKVNSPLLSSIHIQENGHSNKEANGIVLNLMTARKTKSYPQIRRCS